MLILSMVTVVCGWGLDLLRNYRYLFLLSGVSAALGIVASLAVLRQWKSFGGDHNYQPPFPSTDLSVLLAQTQDNAS